MKFFVACFAVLAGSLVCSAGEEQSVLANKAPTVAEVAPATNDGCAGASDSCCCRPGVFARAAARRDCRVIDRTARTAARLTARAAEACCEVARRTASCGCRLATGCRCCR